jgi:hypothetical protein
MRVCVCLGAEVTHEGNISALRVQKLSPGSTFWTEEQSRRNFESASKLVVPGDALSDWLTLAEWVRGKKAGGSSDK